MPLTLVVSGASFSTRLPHKLFCLLFSTSVLECLTCAVLCSTSLIFLDAYQGPLQWQTSYNLVALRHISFAVDKHWSSNQLAVWEPVRAQHDTLKVRCIETEDPYYSNCLFCQRQVCCESTCMHAHANLTCTLPALCRGYIAVCMYWAMLLLTSLSALQARQKTSLPASAYNLITYLAYVYYPPLYIAGPICTFNSFASQLRVPMRLQHKYVSFPV